MEMTNRIEGIYTTDKRLEELVSQKAEPRNHSEQKQVQPAGMKMRIATNLL